MTTYSEILEAAMSLAPTEREELAITLFESADEPAGDDAGAVSAAWRSEIVQRSEAYKRGDLTPLPWKDVLEEVRRKFSGHA